jgi:hypothetical protein
MIWISHCELYRWSAVTDPTPASAMFLCRYGCQGYGVPLDMHRMRPEHLEPEISDRSVAADVLAREEPDEEEEEEEEDNGEADDNEDDEQDGYSEAPDGVLGD